MCVHKEPLLYSDIKMMCVISRRKANALRMNSSNTADKHNPEPNIGCKAMNMFKSIIYVNPISKIKWISKDDNLLTKNK